MTSVARFINCFDRMPEQRHLGHGPFTRAAVHTSEASYHVIRVSNCLIRRYAARAVKHETCDLLSVVFKLCAAGSIEVRQAQVHAYGHTTKTNAIHPITSHTFQLINIVSSYSVPVAIAST